MTRAEAVELAGRVATGYRLAPPGRIVRGPAGVYAGAAAGQSIDFHDHREYHPGDDLRRVDWRAYARGAALQLKLFREEIAPIVEIVLDASGSMGAYAGKEEAAVFIAALVAGAARAVEGRPVLLAGHARWSGPAVEAGLLTVVFAGGANRPEPSEGGIHTHAARVVIGDFLFEEGVAACFARYAAGTPAFEPVRLRSRSERDPSDWLGGHRFLDAEEENRRLDLVVTPAVVAAYRRRLERHEESLAIEAARYGGRLHLLDVPDDALDPDACDGLADALIRVGLLVPA